MLEPVLGEGGVLLHAPGYLQAVRKICDDMNILLIFDEIQTGLGRTGRLFAHELSGVIPDVLTLAKSLGAGLPVGACLAKDSVASALGPGEHASTFGGNFLVCEAAKKFLHIILEKGFLGTVNDTGAHFLNRLLELKSRFPVIQEVRGIGLMIGMDLSIPGQPLVVQALKKGLVINCVQEKTLRFLPPLIITPREIDDGIKILTEVFAEAEKGTGL
jgi:acetylornithine/succinyldiaminopimelate/putrescine aminotransferase